MNTHKKRELVICFTWATFQEIGATQSCVTLTVIPKQSTRVLQYIIETPFTASELGLVATDWQQLLPMLVVFFLTNHSSG
jgi:hypothetical protein